MLAWLTQSSAAENGLSRHRDQESSVNDGKDVIYAAKNQKKGTSFVCSAPAGSRHATAVAGICGQVYKGPGGQDDAQRADERLPKEAKRISGSLPTDSRRHQPEYTQKSPRKRHQAFGRGFTSGAVFDDDDDDDDDDDGSTTTPSEVTSVSALSSMTSGIRHDRRYHGDAPKGRHSARGFRHDDGAKTTYFMERDGRTMFVSAPKGTSEAAVFDAVAQKGIANGVRIRYSAERL